MLAERKVVTKIEANPLLTAREKERSLVRVAVSFTVPSSVKV